MMTEQMKYVSGVLKWAHGLKLEYLDTKAYGHRLFVEELDDRIWYTDNYCAFSVQKDFGIVIGDRIGDGHVIERMLRDRNFGLPLTDTGEVVCVGLKTQNVHKYKLPNGTLVFLNENFVKIANRLKLFAQDNADPQHSAIAVKLDGEIVGIIMPIKRNKDGER